MKRFNLVLSILAGILGGALSHYIWTQPVHAEALAPDPKEVRAQSFVLVDSKGVAQGVFSVDQSGFGAASIKLSNGQGREIWKVGGNGLQLIAASTNRK